MNDRWLITPQYFERPEPALRGVVPKGAMVNGPHGIADRSAESMARLHRPIEAFARDTCQAGDRVMSIAGDCCAAIPVLAGSRAAGLDPVLVWIDAHGDFNTPRTSLSQFLGGMPLAMIVGRGEQWMCQSVGLQPLPEERVWLIDGRDLDPLERVALDASAVRRTGMAGLASLRFDAPVHLHIDLDVLDADEVAAHNYPVKGGPSIAETSQACRGFAAANELCAISISGWTGSLDTDGCAQAACLEIIEALTLT